VGGGGGGGYRICVGLRIVVSKVPSQIKTLDMPTQRDGFVPGEVLRGIEERRGI